MNEHMVKCIENVCVVFLICLIIFSIKSCVEDEDRLRYEYKLEMEKLKCNGVD